MSYWRETGKYQTQYNELWDKLVPLLGSSPYVEGETLRAVTKITWDYNNNGFGNNWTGAFNWLVNHDAISAKEASILRPYANCQCVSRFTGQFSDEDPIVIALTAMMDRAIETLIAKGALENFDNLTPHTDDMYNYSEKDDYGWYEEDWS